MCTTDSQDDIMSPPSRPIGGGSAKTQASGADTKESTPNTASSTATGIISLPSTAEFVMIGQLVMYAYL